MRGSVAVDRNSLFNYILLPLVFEVAEDNPIKFELSAYPPDFQQQYRELPTTSQSSVRQLKVLDDSGSEAYVRSSRDCGRADNYIAENGSNTMGWGLLEFDNLGRILLSKRVLSSEHYNWQLSNKQRSRLQSQCK